MRIPVAMRSIAGGGIDISDLTYKGQTSSFQSRGNVVNVTGNFTKGDLIIFLTGRFGASNGGEMTITGAKKILTTPWTNTTYVHQVNIVEVTDDVITISLSIISGSNNPSICVGNIYGK